MSLSKREASFTLSVLVALFVFFSIAVAQTTPFPRIFYSDLESGPNTGGQNGQGAFVTIYGKGFGTTQGSSVVTIGGTAASRYLIWSDTKIAFQIGNSAVTGDIAVNVAGTKSNGLPFTVRPGKIYFVSPAGNDAHRGTFIKPWRTLAKARNSVSAGDIVYAMDGVSATALDSSSASLAITRAGSNGSPIALVSYPGATVTIGSVSGPTYGVRAPSGNYGNWVLAGLTLRGAGEAVDVAGATNWRLVGDDISCPNGSGTGACVHTSSTNQIEFLGNNVHDSGSTGGNDLANYESVEFSEANNVEVGWNQIGNTRSCRALLFSTSGSRQYGLSVHDNYIHDAVCDGVSFSNVDPSQGAVTAYNNIVQHVGAGPAPGGVESNYACINAGGSGLGSVQILNNTFYDCGARANADSGGISATTPVAVTNNIFALVSGEAYVTPNTSTSGLSGSNDLFWGAGAIPAPFTSSLDSDPLFVDIANANFHVQQSSPAVNAGTNTGVAVDYDGIPRPQGSAYDIGAYELVGTPQATGQLTENPSSLSFGTVAVGASSTQSVSVSNTGSPSVTISQMNITGAGFSSTGLNLPATLATGQSASFTVTFAPQAAGSVTGSIALISDAANATSTVQLSATGATAAGTLAASPSSLSLGSVVVGSSATQNVTVTASAASVTISQAAVTGAGLSLSGPTLPATLSAGQSATFQVKFAPTAAGSVTGSLSLSSNASNSPTVISLSGSGTSPAGTLAASPSSLSLGSVVVGSSATQNVTVTASAASVTISQSAVTGAGFSLSGPTLPATLSAGQSATFQVKFAPTAAGSVTGSLSLSSNASNPPTVISLSGTGALAISHSVTLTWLASTSTNVAGYYIYRGTQSGGPYTRLNAMPVAATTYTDSNVTAGTTYYYVVTAVDSSGTESVYSAEVSAAIPTP